MTGLDIFALLKGLKRASQQSTPAGIVSVFTVCGTGQKHGDGKSTNFVDLVAALLDPTKFKQVPIAYPAGIPFGSSVNSGGNALIQAIRANPGEFVILGYSQGAMVGSQVYQQSILPATGSLHPRSSDFLGAVMLGNPFRKVGTGWPGFLVSSTSHGIGAANKRMTTIPTGWREAASPADLAADINDDMTGQWLSTIFSTLDGGDVMNLVNTVTETVAESGSSSLTKQGKELLSYFGIGPTIGTPPHTQYATYVPDLTGGGNTKTWVHLAGDYINSLAP